MNFLDDAEVGSSPGRAYGMHGLTGVCPHGFFAHAQPPRFGPISRSDNLFIRVSSYVLYRLDAEFALSFRTSLPPPPINEVCSIFDISSPPPPRHPKF